MKYNGEVTERPIGNRVIFAHRGDQRNFLYQIRDKLGAWDKLAIILKYHPRTIRDWVREKNRMSHTAALVLAKRSKILLPPDAKIYDWRLHLVSAGQIGRRNWRKKYIRVPVDEEYRKRRWREWWKRVGKNKFHPILNKPLPVQLPKKSEALAEFVGILLGDGTISKRQIAITLHRIDDAQYSYYVRRLILRLFRVKPGVTRDKDCLADSIVISRTRLVSYFIERLELKVGNKVRQQVGVPRWITRNNKFYRACVRGLLDTDGCVFVHTYTVNGRQYQYRKISFTNHSEPIRQAVYKYFKQVGLKPRLAGDYQVRLDSGRSVQQYFKLIGSHNPKYLKR